MEEKLTRGIREDLKCVLKEARNMGAKEVRAFRNIPLKNIEVVISALEKQIPKKPSYDGDGYAPDGTFVWDEWICPTCGSRYEVDYDEYDYCPNCGQKLERSEWN